MNIYYYLFYKLSSALNKHGKNEWGPIGAITFLISINIGLTYINIFSVTSENFSKGHKIFLVVAGIFLFVSNTFLFLNKKRCKEVTERYEKESLKSKRLGNFFVLIYIVLTLVSIFFA